MYTYTCIFGHAAVLQCICIFQVCQFDISDNLVMSTDGPLLCITNSNISVSLLHIQQIIS